MSRDRRALSDADALRARDVTRFLFQGDELPKDITDALAWTGRTSPRVIESRVREHLPIEVARRSKGTPR